jgi:hypothetical protein
MHIRALEIAARWPASKSHGPQSWRARLIAWNSNKRRRRRRRPPPRPAGRLNGMRPERRRRCNWPKVGKSHLMQMRGPKKVNSSQDGLLLSMSNLAPCASGAAGTADRQQERGRGGGHDKRARRQSPIVVAIIFPRAASLLSRSSTIDFGGGGSLQSGNNNNNNNSDNNNGHFLVCL